MVGLVSIFVTAFIIALSGAMMPGPLLTVTINETVRRGRSAALVLITGHALLEFAMALALFFGLSKVLGNESVIRAIGLVGGFFLLWMGVGIIRDVAAKRVSLGGVASPATSRGGTLIASGVATSLANPYWTFWWATIGAGFLAKSMLQAGAAGFGVFYVGHILGDYAWYGLIGVAVSAGRNALDDRVYRGVLLVCGVFLILLAASFIGGFRLF